MSIPELWQQGEYSDMSLENIAANASNMRFGTNPEYKLSDFLAMYPQFSSVGNAALTIFINLASASLSFERWQDLWKFAMGLFVAHYATLHSQSSENVKAGLAKGIQVSKGVGDVSVSYQLITEGWQSWGSFNLTLFGQQLITMAKTIGAGPVYIW